MINKYFEGKSYQIHRMNTAHDVDVLITEQGVADLRCLTLYECAHLIIEECVHPDFMSELTEYLENAEKTAKYTHGLPAKT